MAASFISICSQVFVALAKFFVGIPLSILAGMTKKCSFDESYNVNCCEFDCLAKHDVNVVM